MPKSKLIGVAKIADRGTSFRVTLPRDVLDKLGASENDYLGFYEVDGTIRIGKIGNELTSESALTSSLGSY